MILNKFANMFGYSILKTPEVDTLIGKERELNAIKNMPTQDIPMEFIYEDTNGNKYFQYKNITAMPGLRALAAEIASQNLSLSLTREELMEVFDKMDECINNENFTDAIYILKDCQYRMKFLATKTTLLELACVYYTMNDESPKDYKEGWKQKKLNAWAADPDAADFFLSKVWQDTKSFMDTSDIDIVNYLKKTEGEERRIWELMRTKLSPAT